MRSNRATAREVPGRFLAVSLSGDAAFAGVLVLVFVSVGFVGILNHEMWRDEMQAWLIASASSSIGNLFDNLRYEGHPGLWHIGLYLLSRFTHNPFAMQVVHLMLAAGVIFILARFSPFTKLEKILLSFGYFPFYEYAVISRNYVLGILCIFSFCALFQTRSKTYFYLSSILSLLANTSVYGLIIALSLGLTLLFERILDNGMARSSSSRKWDLMMSLIIFASGVAIAIIQMIPPADTGLPSGWVTEFDMGRIVGTLTTIWRSYIPIPNFFTYHFWGTNILMSGPMKTSGEICAVLSLGLLVSLLALFARKPVALTLYLSGTFGMLLFTYVKDFGPLYMGSLRHHGHLFILFVACLWLSSHYTDSELSGRFMKRSTDFFYRQRDRFIIGIVCAHLAAGIIAFSIDVLYPFSASKEASKFIESGQMGDLFIVGSRDSAVSPLSGFLHRKIFYPESNRFGSFIVWDKERKVIGSQELLKKVRHLLSQRDMRILLVLNYELSSRRPDISIVEVSRFSKSIVPDEKYYLYLAQRRNIWESP